MAPVSFSVNWAGVVAALDHGEAQKVAVAADGGAAFLGLGGASAALFPPTVPAGLVLSIFAAYCAAEKWLIGATDRGSGVYLTLPWPAIAAFQWWVIVPTSR